MRQNHRDIMINLRSVEKHAFVEKGVYNAIQMMPSRRQSKQELKLNKWQSALIQHGPHTCIKALDRSIVLMTVAVAITSCAFKPQVAVKEGGLSAVTVGIVHQYVTGTL